MAEFYAVRDRDQGDQYAVVVLTDQLRPGYTRAYRWVPNLGEWVADRDLLRDFRSRPGDQVNAFDSIDPLAALRMARDLPAIRSRWVLDAYQDESERLSSAQLGLPLDDEQPRPTTDPHLVETVRNAPIGTWVRVRSFPADKSTAARKWVSEVRHGKKARLAPLKPLEARLEVEGDTIAAYLRRRVTSAAILETAQRIAEAAHAGQQDKAGRPYIDHPRRVAGRLETAGAPAEAIAAGWLHDVLEDTPTTAVDLRVAGVPPETIAAVQAVTKRAAESPKQYADRILATPLAADVKQADLADNSDPERLALLDEATRERLQAKYQTMSDLLAQAERLTASPTG